jgi:hypothetical protein
MEDHVHCPTTTGNNNIQEVHSATHADKTATRQNNARTGSQCKIRRTKVANKRKEAQSATPVGNRDTSPGTAQTRGYSNNLHSKVDNKGEHSTRRHDSSGDPTRSSVLYPRTNTAPCLHPRHFVRPSNKHPSDTPATLWDPHHQGPQQRWRR